MVGARARRTHIGKIKNVGNQPKANRRAAELHDLFVSKFQSSLLNVCKVKV